MLVWEIWNLLNSLPKEDIHPINVHSAHTYCTGGSQQQTLVEASEATLTIPGDKARPPCKHPLFLNTIQPHIPALSPQRKYPQTLHNFSTKWREASSLFIPFLSPEAWRGSWCQGAPHYQPFSVTEVLDPSLSSSYTQKIHPRVQGLWKKIVFFLSNFEYI